MMRKHLIFIPKDNQAMRDYKSGKATKDQFFVFEIGEEEFSDLWKHRVFEILNKKYDLWIDECEEETITAEQLKEAYNAISYRKGSWLSAVNKTIEVGTCAFLHF